MIRKMGKRGASKIMILSIIALIALLLTAFIFGPLGGSMFGTKTPHILDVPKPHVKLPAEGIFHIAGFTITNTIISSWFTIIVLTVLFYFCTRRMKLVPGRLQCFAEIVVEGLLKFVESVAGKNHSRLLFPGVATIFIYVMANAYFALLPFFGTIGIAGHGHTLVPLFRAANTDINVPLSIAFMSFILVESWGIKSLGFLHYISEFINIGQIKEGIKEIFKGNIGKAANNIAFGFINLFVGLLELFSHLIRIVSFTFRLFGNMTAGEILLIVVCFLIPFVGTIPFYGLELLIGFIQALIFAGLTLVFGAIAVTPAHEETE